MIGPGVLDRVYRECLQCELSRRGLGFEVGRAVPVVYKSVPLRSRFYLDLLVGGLVVVDSKAVAAVGEIHTRQVLTQLKLAGLPVALLIHFNVVTLTDGGLKRVINPGDEERGR